MAEENKTENLQEKKSESAVEKGSKESLKITQEEKIELQREYVIPIKRYILHVPQYKRARKAVKVVREFIAKHMKVENRDGHKVRLDMYLNEELWHRGITNPVNKIKVKATKRNGIVYVELVDIPDVVKFKMARMEKRKLGVEKTEIKHDTKNNHVEEGKENTDTKEETKEKQESGKQANEKMNKAKAKAEKHTSQSKDKKTTPRRQVLER